MSHVTKKFKAFLKEWQTQNTFPYRDQLLFNVDNGNYSITIDLEDLLSFDSGMAGDIKTKPIEILPYLDQAAREVYYDLLNINDPIDLPPFQVQFVSKEKPKGLRDLKGASVGSIIVVKGIVINASRTFFKAQSLGLVCKNCKHQLNLDLGMGFSTVAIPRYCQSGTAQQSINQEKCPSDPYAIDSRCSRIIDQQYLKLQELPEDMPAGEIPRTYQICAERFLVDELVPGQRVQITGIYQTSGVKGMKKDVPTTLRMPYIYLLGFSRLDALGPQNLEFSAEEEEAFQTFARDPQVYDKITSNIAPAIYGNDEIKKAVACLMFSGCSKQLPDDIRLRGDINVLLIGDPSTGKSQILKFVTQIAPIAIYTSGKGSSATGLTVSVNKDYSSGEYHIEGGAMVLADGGIVCIDEFDKMKPEDRVAIHEAMEQQTISIAKAGIVSKLNSRTSVLAAANPIFGSYNDMKSIEDQIELQTTILSRFDCIFIIRDEKTYQNDVAMANHILNLHQTSTTNVNAMAEEIDLKFFRRYIQYAKANYQPRLSEESTQTIVRLYVEDRKKAAQNTSQSQKQKSHVPISVRQLEAIIRLGEALAKMTLSSVVTPMHIQEAHRLFKSSTLSTIFAKSSVAVPQDMGDIVTKIQDGIKRRLAIHSRIDLLKLKQELIGRYGNEQAVDLAIYGLVKDESLQEVAGKRALLRRK